MKNIVRVLISLSCLFMLSSCGFQPVYKADTNNAAIAAILASIKIDPLSGRKGQILYTSLEDQLNPLARTGDANYQLSIQLKENEFPVAIEKSGEITRYNIIFTADYALIDSKTQKVIDKGTINTVGSYDAVDSRYSTFTAQSYTVKTTLKEMSEEIKARLIAALYK